MLLTVGGQSLYCLKEIAVSLLHFLLDLFQILPLTDFPQSKEDREAQVLPSSSSLCNAEE